MSLDNHVKFLNAKHLKLEQELNDAYSHHRPQSDIYRIKKEKLKIKDKLTRLAKEAA
ncbi:DUF465 domain-containing protein [Rickettsiales bacterium]|nr:DUF465 domain-containing protein [Rickettsiales bacterium]